MFNSGGAYKCVASYKRFTLNFETTSAAYTPYILNVNDLILYVHLYERNSAQSHIRVELNG